jgi:para-aminobenzoate synthetase
VCLSNRLRLQEQVDGLQLYRVLRECNPAPFSAYLRFGELEIISASPERFLQVDEDRRIETKPIKGTARRDDHPGRDHALAEELRLSDKNRAENLMIVDLMRNDLSQVADTGSVQVPRLMYIESYANVHQLLSTVQARLRDECSLIDLVRATFPGGSITGAPKLRAMQIIDELERSARGVYCGAIGYLGYGCVMDLNIAIRTIVSYGGEISFGAGGGITQLSDAADEFEEIMLKAAGLIRGLTSYQGGAKAPRPYSVRKTSRQQASASQSRDPVLSFTLGSEECAAG